MNIEQIYFLPLEKEHIEIIKNWRNDEEIRKYFFSWRYINKIQQQSWFENYCNDNKQMIFAIVDSKSEDFIGTIGLSDIDHFNQRAELGTLIGNKDYWGKGYATIATNLLLEYAFNNMNLNKIYCQISDSNIASVKKNKKVGFKVEGKLRNHSFGNGLFNDVILMGILREEYYKLNIDKCKGDFDES